MQQNKEVICPFKKKFCLTIYSVIFAALYTDVLRLFIYLFNFSAASVQIDWDIDINYNESHVM